MIPNDHVIEGVGSLGFKLFSSSKEMQRAKNWQDAISRSHAIIELKPDATVVWAHENFLNTMCYSLAEVHGQHNRMFVDQAYA